METNFFPYSTVGNVCVKTRTAVDHAHSNCSDYEGAAKARRGSVSHFSFLCITREKRKDGAAEFRYGKQAKMSLAGKHERSTAGGRRGSESTHRICSKGRLWGHLLAIEIRSRGALPALQSAMGYTEPALCEGPSCIFVGPLETAGKDRLEALYQQARDSYYSGQPLIVDDMFDKVEIRLRHYGSKLVLKYPRCSLRRLSAYADAEADPSQVWALASVWTMLLAGGLVAAAGPPVCALNKVCRDAIHFRFTSHGVTPLSEGITAVNGLLAIAVGLLVGIPIATASVRALQGLWRGDLVALKGACPNCGEEVYAFVGADKLSWHKTECHVCEHPLVFHAKVEKFNSQTGQMWAYGRVYLVIRSKDLSPRKK